MSLSVLEARKQLLLAESDVNRTLLSRETHVLVDGIKQLAEPAKNFGMLAGSVGSILSLFKVFQRPRPEDSAKRPSLFSSLLRYALSYVFRTLAGRPE
jgi:hypothetical protein